MNALHTADAVASGTLRWLEALRDYCEESGRQVRFCQAGSSEMFGVANPPQSETTPFYPRSPYAVSEVTALWYAVNYREAYGLFICNGILFNHESPGRGDTFVSRKITRAVGRILHGLQNTLYLGNLDARRDWGFAGDYVEAMWQILRQDQPDDYFVATGESHSVWEFLEEAFRHVNLDWEKHVEHDLCYLRPTEVDFLRGDASKAREKLGWTPKLDFRGGVHMMVDHDMELGKKERVLRDASHTVAPRGAASF